MAMWRVLAVGIVGAAGVLAGSAGYGIAQQREVTVSCTNAVGAMSWQFMIDYRNATVDANPAKITPTQISWFDPKDGGNYTLDRTSGDLLGSVASATGGYFRRGHCNLEKSP